MAHIQLYMWLVCSQPDKSGKVESEVVTLFVVAALDASFYQSHIFTFPNPLFWNPISYLNFLICTCTICIG